MSEQLLPCPFCGSEPDSEPDGGRWIIDCGNEDCPVIPPRAMNATKDEAIRTWNTRATPPTGEQAASAFESALDRVFSDNTWPGIESLAAPGSFHEALQTAKAGIDAMRARIAQLERDRDSLQHSLDASRDLVNEFVDESATLRASLAAAQEELKRKETP